MTNIWQSGKQWIPNGKNQFTDGGYDAAELDRFEWQLPRLREESPTPIITKTTERSSRVEEILEEGGGKDREGSWRTWIWSIGSRFTNTEETLSKLGVDEADYRAAEEEWLQDGLWGCRTSVPFLVLPSSIKKRMKGVTMKLQLPSIQFNSYRK